MMAHTMKRKPDAARDFPARFPAEAPAKSPTVRAGMPGGTVPAAWPSGMSQLMQTYVACQRCVAQDACADFLTSAPDSIQMPPAFCPNEAEFARLNKVKSRG